MGGFGLGKAPKKAKPSIPVDVGKKKEELKEEAEEELEDLKEDEDEETLKKKKKEKPIEILDRQTVFQI
jgi:hypothetical protein